MKIDLVERRKGLGDFWDPLEVGEKWRKKEW